MTKALSNSLTSEKSDQSDRSELGAVFYDTQIYDHEEAIHISLFYFFIFWFLISQSERAFTCSLTCSCCHNCTQKPTIFLSKSCPFSQTNIAKCASKSVSRTNAALTFISGMSFALMLNLTMVTVRSLKRTHELIHFARHVLKWNIVQIG
jgi:hypothetical protein